LVNVPTKSRVSLEARLFEAIDTTSRRLRFPQDREVIVTDTVGFIRELPQELVGAFRTTLDELREADLLVHVVDASAPDVDVQISAVVTILDDLNLGAIPRTLVFNKCDRLPQVEADLVCRRYAAIGISAIRPETLHPLLEHLAHRLAAVLRQEGAPPAKHPASLALASRL